MCFFLTHVHTLFPNFFLFLSLPLLSLPLSFPLILSLSSSPSLPLSLSLSSLSLSHALSLFLSLSFSLSLIGTIFAYGQTGTGKTYTMMGVRGEPELQGIIPNSFAHVFGYIAQVERDTRSVPAGEIACDNCMHFLLAFPSHASQSPTLF